MKYTVTVAGNTYEVEIENLNARPILARVDGETFEVTPENNIHAGGGDNPRTAKMPLTTGIVPEGEAGSTSSTNGKVLFAPLPGNVTEIYIKPGEEVQTGQVMLVIEAMKMKNSIRSTHAGKVATVLVSVGQTVTHKQALVEFEE